MNKQKDFLNDLTGVKPSIHFAIEEYAKLVVPKPIESLDITYVGYGCWRIVIGVNPNVYSFLTQKRGTLKGRFQRRIKTEMLKMFPFIFDVHINLSV